MKSMNHYTYLNLKNQMKSKWNLVFSKNSGSAWISFKPKLGLYVYPCYACRDMWVNNFKYIKLTDFVKMLVYQGTPNKKLRLHKYEKLTFYLP